MAYIIYIGAAIAIGLLIGLIVLSILWQKKRMVRNVRKHTIGLISAYDQLLEEKSRELAAVEEQLTARAAAITEQTPAEQSTAAPCVVQEAGSGVVLAAAERAATTPYRDQGVGEVYRTIRENFSYRAEELLPGFAGQRAAAGPAQRLLEQLSFDTVYQLSTISAEEQICVLRECLPQDGLPLLEGYLEQCRSFGSLEFYDSLRAAAACEAAQARLYVAPGTPLFPVGAGVEVIADEEICEGFRAEVDGKLYDYCIARRDLN